MYRYFHNPPFVKYHIIEHSSSGSAFWGAFWGAFLAFIFGLIAYRITKRWDRFLQHKNSLVKLDNLLNRHLDEIAAIKFQAGDIKKLLRDGKLTHARFQPFKLPENLEMDFGSLEIANRYLAYSSSISRTNGDMASVNHALNRFEDVLINGQVLKKENLDFMADMLEKLEKFLDSLTNRAKETLVMARLHINKLKSKNSFFFGVLNSNWELSFTPEEIRVEAEKLEGEIEMISKKSKEEIDSALSG
ncbi:MAG TPA: hypothetical protein VJH67_00395 [Candidatus Paceibacterota bacterium]